MHFFLCVLRAKSKILWLYSLFQYIWKVLREKSPPSNFNDPVKPYTPALDRLVWPSETIPSDRIKAGR